MNPSGSFYFLIAFLIFFGFGGMKTLASFGHLGLSGLPLLLTGFSLFYLIHAISKKQTQDKQLFMSLLVQIAIHMVRHDQKIDPQEIEAIKGFFKIRLRFPEEAIVDALIQDALQHPQSLEVLCHTFKNKFPYEYRLLLLELLFLIASSDYVVTESEKALLNQIAEWLHVNPADFQRFYSPPSSNPEEDYYEVLGVKKGCGLDELKKAYKQACKKFHPDKVQHLGEELRRVSEEKIKKINQAYEFLKNKVSP